MDLKEIIFALCSAQGVSGSEESACAVAARYLEPYSEVRTDHNGNLFATLGNPDAKKTVLLDAHLDRIGLIVTDINDKGFVKVDKCGGMDIRVLQNAVLTTEDGLTGTVCSLPPHLSDGSEDKATPINKIWLDFGMSYEEVSRKISVGDKLTFREQPTELLGGKITSPALDNRCSVAALIRVAELLSGRELDYKVIILLSAQEETYGSGAMTGAFQMYGNIELNKGPMLGYSPILNRQMTERLKALAESEGIPLQYEAMSGRTGTNADHISVTKSGVKTAMLSIPERYMHTQAEVMHPDDAERTAKLIAAYILSGGAFDD